MYGIAGLLTGRTLAGRYLIEAVIGRGGMGAVYRATDERLSRPVAVKVVGAITNDPAEQHRLRARFQREARAAAALRHTNVCQVHDFGTDPELDLDFLVMELLHGEDLAARLMRAGPPPLAESIAILRQAARGLAAGHRAGMVHRDVKPGNLFLEDDDAHGVHVRVLDFGIAQVGAEDGTMTQLTVYGRSPFSPAYASPEQLRGDDHITAASDVFSLGAVGYHLVTGTRPFTSSEPARASAEVSDAVRLLRQRAPALDDATYAVLVRSLARTPVERFADAGQMADALSGASPTNAESRPRTVIPPAAAPAPQPTYARSTPSPPPRAVPADEGTRLYAPTPQPARPAPQPHQVPAQMVYPSYRPPVPAQGGMPGQWAPEGMLQTPQPVPPRPGPVRRFFRAAWEFTLTTVALGLFAASWVLAIQGVAEDRPRRLIAGVAATVLFTPYAVHRLTGRRGRYGFGVIGSLAATILAWRVVGRGGGDSAVTLAAVFGLQVLACFLMSWLTRRREPEPPQPYPTS